jgi:peroxiredoxin
MGLMHTPGAELGAPAPEFDLPGIDGRRWTLSDARGKAGLLVMFICNHCPYVKAIRERLVVDCNVWRSCPMILNRTLKIPLTT